MNTKETWKEVEGYNGVYFVSNIGRVKSVDHFCKNRNGSGKQTGRVLKLCKSYKGYLRVSLSNNCKTFTTGAHRLVAKAFIPNPNNKPQVNHKNGIKHDNRVENLEWVSNSENQIHALKNGFKKIPTGEKHHNSKLRNDEVLKCRKLHGIGFTTSELARDYNLSVTAMSNILRNKTYKNIK